MRNYSIASKAGGTAPTVNNAIVTNTPHKFISGGYKLQTTTWDGKRIDDFAAFLASLDIYRAVDDNDQPAAAAASNNKELLLAPRDRAPPARIDRAQDELDAKRKYAEEIKRQKTADVAAKRLVLRRIEEDKVVRALKQAREREARLYRGAKGTHGAGRTSGVYSLKDGALTDGPVGDGLLVPAHRAVAAEGDPFAYDADFWTEDLQEHDMDTE